MSRREGEGGWEGERGRVGGREGAREREGEWGREGARGGKEEEREERRNGRGLFYSMAEC